MKTLALVTGLALVVAGSSLAANFLLTKTDETSNTITFSYPAQPNADGWRYYAPGAVSGEECSGTRVARSFDPDKLTVRFGKVASGTYCVEAIQFVPVGAGQFPVTSPAAPPTATFEFAPAAPATGQNVTFDWTGTCAAGDCTLQWEDEGPDGPGGTDFPWGTGDPFVMSFVNVGTKYAHLIVTDKLGRTAESRQQVNVAATPPPPPPPPGPVPTGYPNADNTGVPPGTALTTFSSGHYSTSSNGQVVENLNVTNGCVMVDHYGVVIRNSQVRCVYVRSSSAQNPANQALHVHDVTILCDDAIMSNAIWYKNFVAERVDISGPCSNGADINSYVTIRDSYIHALGPRPIGDAHVDGLQASWGAHSLIEHNTILSIDTSAIAWFNYDGNASVPNWTINNNLLGAETAASVAYLIYCPSGTSSNAFITNNRFKNEFPPAYGHYTTGCNRPGITWANNVIHETGQPVAAE